MKHENSEKFALQADAEQIGRFLNVIFKKCPSEGWFVLRGFEHEREGRPPVINEWVPFNREIVKRTTELATYVANLTGPERAVFSPPVAIFGDLMNKRGTNRSGGENNVICAPAIAVELDSNPQAALATLTDILGEPTLIVASGGTWEGKPKLHAYWRLGEPAKTAEERALLKQARYAATRIAGGDRTGVALSHPMRMPGSWHTKGAPALCKIVGGNHARDIKLSWAVAELEKAAEAAGIDLDRRYSANRAAGEGFKTEKAWPLEKLMKAAELIPNDDTVTWDDWSTMLMALYDASHGSDDGLDAAIYWSEKNPKGVAENTIYKWEHIGRYPPDNLSAGTLVQKAREVDPEYVPDRLKPEDWFDQAAASAVDEAPLFPEIELNPFQAPTISLTPLRQFDPKTLPRRQWLYGNHYIRKYVSATAAPSAVGKSSMTMVEALAMATGKPLLGVQPKGTYRVWIWNGEDPIEELELRIAAAMQHYGLTWADLGDRVFLDSGRVMPVVLATSGKQGAQIAVPVVEGVIAGMKANAIDVAIMDPFVSTFSGPETNEMFEPIVKKWGFIAGATNASVELVHHTRKLNGAETGVEDMRGGGALVAGARAKRVLARMSASEAKKFGVREDDHRRFFRVADASVNMALPAVSGTTWFEMKGVPVGNGEGEGPLADVTGDHVGVATLRAFASVSNEMDETTVERIKDALRGGEWRENFRSNAWAGFAVADVMGLDPKEDRSEIEQTLREMKGMNAIRIDRRTDKNGNKVPFVVVVEADNTSGEMDRKSENPFD